MESSHGIDPSVRLSRETPNPVLAIGLICVYSPVSEILHRDVYIPEILTLLIHGSSNMCSNYNGVHTEVPIIDQITDKTEGRLLEHNYVIMYRCVCGSLSDHMLNTGGLYFAL